VPIVAPSRPPKFTDGSCAWQKKPSPTSWSAGHLESLVCRPTGTIDPAPGCCGRGPGSRAPLNEVAKSSCGRSWRRVPAARRLVGFGPASTRARPCAGGLDVRRCLRSGRAIAAPRQLRVLSGRRALPALLRLRWLGSESRRPSVCWCAASACPGLWGTLAVRMASQRED